jgi:hypothetical protein
MELDYLVRIGVLASQQKSEWVSPSFIIPKKDGRVHWISDLLQLNKIIRVKQYPLPIITDNLCKCSECKFFIKIDVSMQYYTFELDKVRQGLFTIIMPFGKYKYLRLPMGLKRSPNIAIKDADINIDDVGAFSSNWEHHINLLLATILQQLRENGLTINPPKCE